MRMEISIGDNMKTLDHVVLDICKLKSITRWVNLVLIERKCYMHVKPTKVLSSSENTENQRKFKWVY